MTQAEDQKQIADLMADMDDVQIYISIQYLWLIVAGLQLVTRHPNMSNVMLAAYETIGKKLQAVIEDKHPDATEIMNKGWNAQHDVDDDGQTVREVHNAWTIYGMNPDGTESEEKFAEISRPQDWGHPRWTYRPYVFHQWDDEGMHYINHCHAWTDIVCKPHEMTEMFSGLICTVMMPGDPVQICAKDFLKEDDFWSEEWGVVPPVFDPYEDDPDWDL